MQQNRFLLVKKFKNTKSAQLCEFEPSRKNKIKLPFPSLARSRASVEQLYHVKVNPIYHVSLLQCSLYSILSM